MSRRIAVTINADGSLKAETLGIKGRACLDYVPILEDLLEAVTQESAFTADYQATTEQLTGRAVETLREHPPV